VTLAIGELRTVDIPVEKSGSLRLHHTGSSGKLTCRIEHGGMRLGSHSVEQKRNALVTLPPGAYDLHLAIVEKGPEGDSKTLREEVRRVEVTPGAPLDVAFSP